MRYCALLQLDQYSYSSLMFYCWLLGSIQDHVVIKFKQDVQVLLILLLCSLFVDERL